MFDFVPVGDYTHYFDILVLIMILAAVVLCQQGTVLHKEIVNITAGFGFILAACIILYMGLRPISSAFGDTVNYAHGFKEMSHVPFRWSWNGDFLFYNLMHLFARYGNIHSFFLCCAFLYVFPLWLAMQRIFKSYYFIPFLVILCMFTFWNYGVNGIRNGIASSLFILGIAYIDMLPVTIGLCLMAIGFHKSTLLMVGAAVLTWFFENSSYYLAGWIASIPISYVWGSIIQTYIAGSSLAGDDDERLSQYLLYTKEQGISDGLVVDMSFRWDLLAYSAIAVVIGYYFIFRRNFKDEYYHWIFNTFLVTNAFWILVIRAAYSNRFAQISWFIMPIVLIYPFMKKRFWINHEKMLGYALLMFYAFAFYYNILRG